MNIIENKTIPLVNDDATAKDVAINLLLAKRNVPSNVVSLLKAAHKEYKIVDLEGETMARGLNSGERALVGSMLIKEGGQEGLVKTLESLMSEVVRANSALLNFVAMNSGVDELIETVTNDMTGMVSYATRSIEDTEDAMAEVD